MGTLIKKKMKVLAALLAVILIIDLQIPSAASSVIDPESKGTLTVQPKYNGDVIRNCTFDVYRVAEIDFTSASLKYNLLTPFQSTGVDLNAAVGGGAEALENAANTLADLSEKPDPTASLSAGEDKISDLSLGAYLVVQTEAPGRYRKASPFLVFLPYTGTETGGTAGWIYDVTAYPKLGRKSSPENPDNPTSPGGEEENPSEPIPPIVTDVKVVKIWNDAGSEEKRPASITVSLFKDSSEYASQVLSAANGWQCEWTGLASGSAWTVSEKDLPDGYSATTASVTDGSTCVYTITNSYGEIPPAGSLYVYKKWEDKGHEKERPSAVKAGLYGDGKLEQTVELNAKNGWKYSWQGLDGNKTWIVSEIGESKNYTSTLVQTGSVFTITNTYRTGGETANGVENPPTKAPQTGLIQWPIPVLAAVGAALILCGAVFKRKEKHE